jgi:multidrug efflux pump subunit AcrA (membrane-fusion protein)
MLDASANAINEKSDALLVEFLANNSDGTLKPGGYAQVTIGVPTRKSVMTVPASALIFDQNGLQVATVMRDNRIRLKHIKIERDLGTEVEINAGLDPRDRVVDNPPDSIANGDRVMPQALSVAASQ